MRFEIQKNIEIAETLPSLFYTSDEIFEAVKDKIFTRSWQWIGDISMLNGQHNLIPFFFMEHFLDEPLLFSKTIESNIQCLSNVCTHRGNIMIQYPQNSSKINCSYHGRRFSSKGEFEYTPEFAEAKSFPRICDHLKSFPFINWKDHLFVTLESGLNIESILNQMNDRVAFLDFNQLKRDDSLTRGYQINAHWALYCDNYLEGFHIPFVHHGLNEALDYGKYETRILNHMVLQIGYTDSSEMCFDLPKNHMDYGKNVAAYYYWLFPNIMFNFYPWGLSINVVKPINKNRTKVSFISFVSDYDKLQFGAGADLDKVEREDEFVVESVHRGLKSRYYNSGRYSPSKEKGVHYFHSLLSDYHNK